MPKIHRLTNLKLLYRAKDNGYAYYHIFNFFKGVEELRPFILLIKTTENEVFGAFLEFTRPENTHSVLQWEATGDCFVFKLIPEVIFVLHIRINLARKCITEGC